jgi:hypothetical protein
VRLSRHHYGIFDSDPPLTLCGITKRPAPKISKGRAEESFTAKRAAGLSRGVSSGPLKRNNSYLAGQFLSMSFN